MPDILHRITVKAAPDAVFAAVTTAEGLRSWWTKSSRAEPQEGSVFVFGFEGGSVEFHFRVDELVDNKRTAWTCVAAPKVPDEWVDTRVTFDLEPTDDGATVVSFAPCWAGFLALTKAQRRKGWPPVLFGNRWWIPQALA